MASRKLTVDSNQGLKLVFGLGNPGNKFKGTRHNIGFDLIDIIAEEHGIVMTKSKFNSFFGTGTIGSQSVVLVKPQTFMNLSGSSVKPWADYFKVSPSDMLIVHDAADLPVGGIKLKIGGTSGGQNGIKHIIEKLGTPTFPRLKLGVGRPEQGTTDLATWVLTKFPSSESSQVEELLLKGKNCLLTWVEHGSDKAMCDFNAESGTRQKKVKPTKTVTAPSPAPSEPSEPTPASSTSVTVEG